MSVQQQPTAFRPTTGTNKARDAALSQALRQRPVPGVAAQVSSGSKIANLVSSLANYPDGTLLKASGPQIDLMQGHERRWIPDPQTFNYMGLDWSAIQTIADSDWNAIAVGPPFPSRSDGTILRGPVGPPFGEPEPAVYVMQSGQRRLIPDPATFNALGYNWSAIQSVLDSDLDAIPLGPQIPEGGGVHPAFPIVASQDNQFSGSGGYMHTDATIYASGLMNAVTHTWEVTDLRGFKGAVAVALLDQAQNKIWCSATQHFGVDGRWIGTSDRFDNWSDTVPTDILANARYLAIIQQWDPNLVADIEAWLAGLTNPAQAIAAIIQAIVLIFSL
jgi:hypothetical protein